MPKRVTRFDLMRHGETEGGSRYRGSINDALTPQGWVAMRTALGEENKWDHIISSPLHRCADFARNLAERHALPLVLDARLREIYFGAWEGKTATELLARAICVLSLYVLGLGLFDRTARHLLHQAFSVARRQLHLIAASSLNLAAGPS